MNPQNSQMLFLPQPYTCAKDILEWKKRQMIKPNFPSPNDLKIEVTEVLLQKIALKCG